MCTKQAAKYWEELVEKDNEIRNDLGLPTPSADELQLLLDAPLITNKTWTNVDIVLLLRRSKYERMKLDEMKAALAEYA